ncbi:hypothetical protein C2857_002215 [Epichloe festucae Fl1]|uniref:Polycomb protein VEFS-Box domain-containing protein n=1 Tax=Epichloe festucae (strain Fl1) TaxID=877507 RepID=A0A7S9PRW3_EPIFF|nr:hypothetical protein C2857_002215 [Epichloe festucae Fl1]
MTAQSPCKRTAPFLQRNWLKNVKALQNASVMGNIISTPMMQKLSSDADGDDTRPAKRCRISSHDSFDIDHLIASPRMSESGSTLRIEVLKILHKDSKKVKSYQATAPRDVLTTKARCKVTIFDTSSGPPQLLHCQSQMCDLITFENPAGPHHIARVNLPRPFFVPHDSILINRPDDGGFDLSDSYQLLIEIEAANALHWPPLNPQDLGIPAESLYPPWGSTQHWILSSKFDKVFGRLKNPLNLSARYPPNQPSHQTNYVMDVDLRWTAGFKALRRLDKGSKNCITAIDPDAVYSDEALSPGVPPVNGIHNHTVTTESPTPNDQEDDFGGDQTPSRSLRAREKNKIYNLKVLSDQQLGRERKQPARNLNVSSNEGRIQYVLPLYQPVSLDYYRCINCGAYHESMDQLQLHLQLSHPTYEYTLEDSNDGPLFRVSALRESTMSPQKTYHLGRNIKPFHIRTMISGDQTWLVSRFGPDMDESLKSPTKNALGRMRTASPISKAQKIVPRRPENPKPVKAVVPDIPQPLFHPISKARLKPGQDVPQNAPDNTWLIQKHRESIGDFSDVTPAEKEYIWEWDGFILRQNVMSAAYFPRAWLSFVQGKASWLASAGQRMLEFAKHSSVLLARNALDDDDMQQAFKFINEARAKRSQAANQQISEDTSPSAKDGLAKQSPRASQIRKCANGCQICRLPVLSSRILLCSNKASLSFSLVQSDCIMPIASQYALKDPPAHYT